MLPHVTPGCLAARQADLPTPFASSSSVSGGGSVPKQSAWRQFVLANDDRDVSEAELLLEYREIQVHTPTMFGFCVLQAACCILYACCLLSVVCCMLYVVCLEHREVQVQAHCATTC